MALGSAGGDHHLVRNGRLAGKIDDDRFQGLVILQRLKDERQNDRCFDRLRGNSDYDRPSRSRVGPLSRLSSAPARMAVLDAGWGGR